MTKDLKRTERERKKESKNKRKKVWIKKNVKKKEKKSDTSEYRSTSDNVRMNKSESA